LLVLAHAAIPVMTHVRAQKTSVGRMEVLVRGQVPISENFVVPRTERRDYSLNWTTKAAKGMLNRFAE
jgi:hypothetical protein